MASLFDQYPNEEAFRQEFVRALLNRLGFSHIDHLHGSFELGKDFVFADLHVLARVRFYGAVVKHARKISSGKAVDDIWTQVQQAFASTIKVPESTHSVRLSSVFVFNSGSITAQAREDLNNRFLGTYNSANVFFLDGDQLQDRAHFVVYERNALNLRRIRRLERELELNCRNWQQFDSARQLSLFDIRGSLLVELEEFLIDPPDTEAISYDAIERLWHEARVIDRLTQGMVQFIGDGAWLERNGALLRERVKAVLEAAWPLFQQIDNAVELYKPIIREGLIGFADQNDSR